MKKHSPLIAVAMMLLLPGLSGAQTATELVTEAQRELDQWNPDIAKAAEMGYTAPETAQN